MKFEVNRRTFLKTTSLAMTSLSASRWLSADEGWQPTWNSLTKHAAPSWFEDAKFGIYFHWGIFSVPAFDNEWYSRNMYIEGRRANKFHKEVYGPPAKFGYKDFIPMFHAEKFNPEEWAELFRKAGAKFCGPVTEHADGFSMWDSKVNKWNAAQMGPKRDVVGEMSRALRNEGIKFIATLHHQWLWGWYPTLDKSLDCSKPEYSGLYGPPAPQSPFDYDTPNPLTPPPSQTFQEVFIAKINEVIDGYHPSLIYFDSRLNIIDQQRLASMISYYYNQAEKWGEEVTVTYKNEDLPKHAGLLDIERGRLSEVAPFYWLTDDAIDWNSWCDVQNPRYKSANRTVGELVDIVSKNGNLLLDITPHADGVIPEPVVERLLAIGRWLRVNGEAMYGTRPWKVFGEGPTQVSGGYFNEQKIPDFTANDIRFTSRETTLYATVLAWPKDTPELAINSLGTGRRLLDSGKIADISLLGNDTRLSWHHDVDALRIKLPAQPAGEFAYAFKVSLK